MSFGIFLHCEISREFDQSVLLGKIKIDNYSEDFFASAEFWRREDYLESWKRSLAEGLQGGGRCALIASINDPVSSNFLFYWVIYLEGDVAYVQNGVLFINELPVTFDPSAINGYVPARAEVNEEGVAISQWNIDRKSVMDFFNSL